MSLMRNQGVRRSLQEIGGEEVRGESYVDHSWTARKKQAGTVAVWQSDCATFDLQWLR